MIAEAHASDRVVGDFGKGNATLEAFGGPFTVVLGICEAFAALLEAGIVFGEGAEAFAGFLGEALEGITFTAEADGILEDAFGAFEDFGDIERFIQFSEVTVTGEAFFERFVVLERVEEKRNVTHARGWSGGGIIPTFFGPDWLVVTSSDKNPRWRRVLGLIKLSESKDLAPTHRNIHNLNIYGGTIPFTWRD